MARSRSPGYPSISLADAIGRVRKIHDADRRNAIDRAVVATHMGYTGLSGASDMIISALMHFGLLERVGKGEVRVSQTAVDIMHPESEAQRRNALHRAAMSPELFKALKERFPENRFSENALRSYLVRLGFVDRAVEPVLRAYTETCRFLEQEGASESGGDDPQDGDDSAQDRSDNAGIERRRTDQIDEPVPPRDRHVKRDTQSMSDERVLTTGLLSKEAHFRLIVSGSIGVKEIENLIKKLELDKEILADVEEGKINGGVSE